MMSRRLYDKIAEYVYETVESDSDLPTLNIVIDDLIVYIETVFCNEPNLNLIITELNSFDRKELASYIITHINILETLV